MQDFGEMGLYPEALTVPTVPEIIEKVCAVYRIRPAKVLSRDRTSHVTAARHVAIYLAKRLLDQGEVRLGQQFNRDHSSVNNAFHRIKGRADAEPGFCAALNKLERELRGF